jgi:hypothetical protein
LAHAPEQRGADLVQMLEAHQPPLRPDHRVEVLEQV